MPTRQLELDATTVKALAHPLRMQIIRVLELRQRASVTSLAAELGETTGTTSYHLRQLSRHGFVEQFDPEPDHADDASSRVGRRQRWWRMAVDSIHLSGTELVDDSATGEAARYFVREGQQDSSRRLAHWHATMSEWPPAWEQASSDFDGFLDLDPARTRALADEMRALIERYRDLPAGDGTRRIDVQFAVFPAELGERP